MGLIHTVDEKVHENVIITTKREQHEKHSI